MALNLTTPRYHAPDVTKAPLAGEQIRSSQDRSNLARRSQAASERNANADRRLRRDIAADEIDIKMREQRMSLAERGQKMDQEWELHPEKLLQAREQAQSLIESNLTSQQNLRENQHSWEARYNKLLAELEAGEVDAQIKGDNLEESRAQKAQEPVMNHWLTTNSVIANSPRFGADPTLVISAIPATVTGANRVRLEQKMKAWQDNARDSRGYESQQNVAAHVNKHIGPGSPVNPATVKLANAAAAKAAARGQQPPFIPPATGPAAFNWFEGFLDNDGIFDRSIFDAKIKEQRATVGAATQSGNVAYDRFYNTMLTKAEALKGEPSDSTKAADDPERVADDEQRYTSLQDLNKIAKAWADWKFGRGIYSHVGPSYSPATPTATTTPPPPPTGGTTGGTTGSPGTVHIVGGRGTFAPAGTGSTGPTGSSLLRPIPTNP